MRSILQCFFFLFLFLAGTLWAANKPNVIYILTDDLGYGDLGCYGQEKIRTPNIDQLALEGMRFTDHYSGQTVCSPSRAALMLGQHMGHCRIKSNGNAFLIEEDVTIPMLLKKAGYRTGMIGKWGLKGHAGHPGSPNNKGFDHWFGFHSQGVAHFFYPDFLWRNEAKVHYPENRNVRENGYYKSGKGSHAHDLFAREAEWFIRDSQQGEHKGRPFFLYIPFAIPHAELIVPSDCPDLAYYQSLNWPETVKKEGGGGGGYGTKYVKGYCAQDHPHATYAAMISRMDRSVGKIMALLKELKIDEKTLVFFTSDNGPSAEGGQTLEFFNSRGPLRGYKRSIYEGGTRVPMIARWPQRIQAGATSSHVSAFWDVMPSLCELAGVAPSEITNGISFVPELLGQEQKKHDFIYYNWRGAEAVRVGKWKLVKNDPGKQRIRQGKKWVKPEPGAIYYELYDLSEDIGEKHDKAGQMPERVDQLKPYLKKAVR